MKFPTNGFNSIRTVYAIVKENIQSIKRLDDDFEFPVINQ